MDFTTSYNDDCLAVFERITQTSKDLTCPLENAGNIFAVDDFITSLLSSKSFKAPHDRSLEEAEASFISACCYVIFEMMEKQERTFGYLAKMLYWGTTPEYRDHCDSKLDRFLNIFCIDRSDCIAAKFYSEYKSHKDVFPSYVIARDCLFRLDHYLRNCCTI